MAAATGVPALSEWAELVETSAPLAPYTYLRLGGPAQALVTPRTPEQLAAILRRCRQESVPVRFLGGGCNILPRDEGVRGGVIRLSAPPFGGVRVQSKVVRAGSGTSLSSLISEAARHDL